MSSAVEPAQFADPARLARRGGDQPRKTFKNRYSFPASPDLSGILSWRSFVRGLHVVEPEPPSARRFSRVVGMVVSSFSQLRQDLEQQISLRTGRRVRNLAVELEPERVVLRGLTNTYHVKQLAQHGVREMLPDVRLDNVIVVEN